MILGTSQIVCRLILAALLSGIIGCERELHGRAAGLRTTILVGVGSCLIMMTSMYMQQLYQGVVPVDPTRIAAQVVSGIGFLGAGTILRYRASVLGLTTAAGIWSVAGIGLAIGSGFYVAGLLTTAIIFLVLVALSRFERKLKKAVDGMLRIELTGNIDQVGQITKTIASFQGQIKDISIASFPDKNMFTISLHVTLFGEQVSPRIAEAILTIKGVTAVKWA
ncbi:MAG: MgtC/SapB family protein [Victivallales bacterium]|nr:MgtC/SapB family protein [Victivallales bacterium]